MAEKADKEVTLSGSDLRTLISEVVKMSNASNEKLVEAIVESRKPYTDPQIEENNKRIRAQMRKQHEQLKANERAAQDTCPHLMGSNRLSDFPNPNGLTSIVHHYLDSGELIGICTNCGRIWRQGDSDYYTWMQTHKSGNRRSESGRRNFMDPAAAIRAGQSNFDLKQ